MQTITLFRNNNVVKVAMLCDETGKGLKTTVAIGDKNHLELLYHLSESGLSERRIQIHLNYTDSIVVANILNGAVVSAEHSYTTGE